MAKRQQYGTDSDAFGEIPMGKEKLHADVGFNKQLIADRIVIFEALKDLPRIPGKGSCPISTATKFTASCSHDRA